MGERKRVKITPGILDVEVVAGKPWAQAITMTALGDLTGATITARHRATGESVSTDLTVTPIDLAAARFSIGQSAAAAGVYDVEITRSGQPPRVWLEGRIITTPDRA